MTEINYQTSTVPISGNCTECGQPFKAGDSITLSPPMHRTCDATAVFFDTALDAMSKEVARSFMERDHWDGGGDAA